MHTLSLFDGTQSVILWHHQNNSISVVSMALIRRFRHRLYTQVVDSAVPVNRAHWYFSASVSPLPGDEITESDGTVWTILEVNQSPLTNIWQAVCESFAFAKATENVAHLRQGVTVTASLPVRVGAMTTILEPDVSHRLTFYVRPSIGGTAITAEQGDIFKRSDGSLWTIVRVEKPMYRARWTAVVAVKQ